MNPVAIVVLEIVSENAAPIYFLLRKGLLAPEKGAYAVILSVAKDLLPKASQQVEEILRFAQNDRLIILPRGKRNKRATEPRIRRST